MRIEPPTVGQVIIGISIVLVPLLMAMVLTLSGVITIERERRDQPPDCILPFELAPENMGIDLDYRRVG